MAMRKPKNIDKNIWDSMSDMQKKQYIRTEGAREAGKQMSRMVGREYHASKTKGRQSEARGVANRAKGVAKKLQDPKNVNKMGGKAVIRHNIRKSTAYRKDGKRVIPPAARKELRALAKDVYRILKKMG